MVKSTQFRYEINRRYPVSLDTPVIVGHSVQRRDRYGLGPRDVSGSGPSGQRLPPQYHRTDYPEDP